MNACNDPARIYMAGIHKVSSKPPMKLHCTLNLMWCHIRELKGGNTQTLAMTQIRSDAALQGLHHCVILSTLCRTSFLGRGLGCGAASCKPLPPIVQSQGMTGWKSSTSCMKTAPGAQIKSARPNKISCRVHVLHYC